VPNLRRRRADTRGDGPCGSALRAGCGLSTGSRRSCIGDRRSRGRYSVSAALLRVSVDEPGTDAIYAVKERASVSTRFGIRGVARMRVRPRHFKHCMHPQRVPSHPRTFTRLLAQCGQTRNMRRSPAKHVRSGRRTSETRTCSPPRSSVTTSSFRKRLGLNCDRSARMLTRTT
jgi:hypothetical protein